MFNPFEQLLFAASVLCCLRRTVPIVALQEKIKNRNNGTSQQVKDTLIVPGLKFNKLVELCQTRRIVWYIAQDKWKVWFPLYIFVSRRVGWAVCTWHY